MKNIYIVNYAFIRFYYESTGFEEFIDFNTAEGRIQLTSFLFNDLELPAEIITDLIKKFYESHDLDTSYLNELYDFLKFSSAAVMHSRDFDLDSQIKHDLFTRLMDINDKIYEAWNFEMVNDFERAFGLLKNLFGENFPDCDDDLINSATTDRLSPYYISN